MGTRRKRMMTPLSRLRCRTYPPSSPLPTHSSTATCRQHLRNKKTTTNRFEVNKEYLIGIVEKG